MTPKRFSRLAGAMAAVVAALALAAAGCGGGGEDTGADLTAGLSGPQLAKRTAEEGLKLKTFTLGIDGVVDPVLTERGRQATGTAAVAPNGPIKFSSKGPVVMPKAIAQDATIQLNLPIQANLTRINGDIYMSAMGRDFQLDLPSQRVASLDAGNIFGTLLSWIGPAKVAGEETIDGAPTVKVAGPMNGAKVARDFTGMLDWAMSFTGPDSGFTPAQATRLATALAANMGDDDTMTVWVRKRDLLPAKLSAHVSFADTTAISPELRALTIDLTLHLTDYNRSLTVDAPQNPQHLSLGDLARLVG